MYEMLNRAQLKQDAKALLRSAQVAPAGTIALYLGIACVVDVLGTLAPSEGILSIFVTIFSSLFLLVLDAGFVLYCMTVRRRERAEYLTLLDGFSFAGKIIVLHILMFSFVFLWSMLFFVPGIIALYRYRFALYNLLENPGITPMEAITMSKFQTRGYKLQLFWLDLSYFGWVLLASAPGGFFYTEELAGGMAPAVVASMPPSLLQILIIDLWALLISIFYLATYQCVELDYWEAAKRTSGTSANAPSQGNGRWPNGPDQMGGY